MNCDLRPLELQLYIYSFSHTDLLSRYPNEDPNKTFVEFPEEWTGCSATITP